MTLTHCSTSYERDGCYEKLGKQEREVTVSPGADVEVEFVLKKK